MVSATRVELKPKALQMEIVKGGILHTWRKKMAVAVDTQFFATLPSMEEVDKNEAELAWLVYDLRHDQTANLRRLTLTQIVYTRFGPALDKITKSEPGEVQDFVDLLQTRLDEVLTMGTSVGTTPDAVSLQDSDEVIE